MLVRQLLSASGSSASKYFTAVLGGHSLSESVLFSAMDLFRLISSFHLHTLLSRLTLQGYIIKDKTCPCQYHYGGKSRFFGLSITFSPHFPLCEEKSALLTYYNRLKYTGGKACLRAGNMLQ